MTNEEWAKMDYERQCKDLKNQELMLDFIKRGLKMIAEEEEDPEIIVQYANALKITINQTKIYKERLKRDIAKYLETYEGTNSENNE